MSIVITIDSVLARKEIMELSKFLGKREVEKAVASALNRVVAMGKTEASRMIRNRYRIKKKDLDKRMGTSKAGQRRLQAKLWSMGTPIPVHLFKYKQTKRGVRVTILGKSSIIPHAFVATVRAGKSGKHTGVFARGKYGPSGFIFRKAGDPGKRRRNARATHNPRNNDLPITQMTTISQGPMFAHPRVMEPVVDRIESYLPARIEHELDRQLRLMGFR